MNDGEKADFEPNKLIEEKGEGAHHTKRKRAEATQEQAKRNKRSKTKENQAGLKYDATRTNTTEGGHNQRRQTGEKQTTSTQRYKEVIEPEPSTIEQVRQGSVPFHPIQPRNKMES